MYQVYTKHFSLFTFYKPFHRCSGAQAVELAAKTVK